MTTKSPTNLDHWGRIGQQTADLFRTPIRNISKLTDAAKTRNRQSQVLRTDPPFKILTEENGCRLVQLADFTFGWLPAGLIEEVKPRDYWQAISRPKKSSLVQTSKPSKTAIEKALKKYQKAPYLWGGTTAAGIDCSGLTQRVVWQLTKVLLPKNSRDQSKFGQSISRDKLCPLDLVFFVHKVTGRSHVGIYFDRKIWHACLDKQGLTAEPLLDMTTRYRFRCARRYFRWSK
jgi:cell wall-associated NlpC family hydrolase